MNHDQVLAAIRAMTYKYDARNPASIGRRSQYKVGWADASAGETTYTESTLDRLTWRNLGYRLGRQLGPRDDDEIGETFDFLAEKLQDDLAERRTWLLVWNPGRWPWKNLDERIDRVANGGDFVEPWSVGVTKRIKPGDRLFLIKLGAEPRGIIGSGWAKSSPEPSPHWDPAQQAKGKTALYVDFLFDALLDPSDDSFPFERLQEGIYQRAHWTPQASGVTIAADVAVQLEADWERHVGEVLAGSQNPLPEEVPAGKHYFEGSVTQVSVNVYERSKQARADCVKHHGVSCAVCGVNFGAKYGDLGVDFIHVHHLKPLSEIGGAYALDPVLDLRPVCPNCHAMIHRRVPALTIEELRARLSV